MRAARILLGLASALSAIVTASTATADTQRSGKALFVQHCARCHTTRAAGLDPSHPLFANFEAPPADFTDPLFNSMEPAADWFRVVKNGGPTMGLSTQMPAHAGRLTDEEIRLVVAYLKTVPDTRCYPRGEVNLRRPIITKKAFPETELLFLGRWDDAEPNEWKSTVYYGHRLGRRWSVEAKPSHVTGGDKNEFEMELGAKFAAYPGQDLLVTIGAEAEFSLEFEELPVAIPYLAHASRLGEHFTLQGALDAEIPLEDAGDGRVRLSEAVHWLTTNRPRGLFPALEVTGWVPFSSEAELGMSLTPQLFWAMSKRGHVALTAGVEIPLRGAEYDWRGHTFLLWDIADGPFWEGW